MIMLKSNNSYANLTDTLMKYCIPKEGYCSNKATYGTVSNKSVCICSACNMYYDETTRSCKTCATGTYVTNKYSTSCSTPTCPDGYEKQVNVGKSVCPDGYYGITLSGC
ncbi:MAG: hypothetical protein K2M23_02650 [Alphaproteobacteria bacterium]|nr:hypothetical protein [Alphaproteobacteria bacterium]